MKEQNIKVGDRVEMSRKWLQNTGTYTGPLPFQKGTIAELKPFPGGSTLAGVRWDGSHKLQSVLLRNLHVLGTPEPE